jgi:hypothetical protein
MSDIGGGMKAIATMEVRNSSGDIVCRFDSKAPRWYDAWRINWCCANRGNWAMPGFREGRINPLTLSFALCMRLKEARNGSWR